MVDGETPEVGSRDETRSIERSVQLLVSRNDVDVGGQARVRTDEERVMQGG